MLTGFQKSRFKIANIGHNKFTVEKIGGECMVGPANVSALAGIPQANAKKSEKTFKTNSGSLDITTSLDGALKATFTNLSGSIIPITFVLSKQQTDKLMTTASKGEDAVAEFLNLMGVDEQAINTLKEMGATEFEKKDDGTISLKLKKGNSFIATKFMGMLTSKDTAVQQWCRDILAQILKMPMEVREEAVKQFVKTIEENSAKDKENLKQMAKKAEEKNIEKKLQALRENKTLMDMIAVLKKGGTPTADMNIALNAELRNKGIDKKQILLEFLINELIANSDKNPSQETSNQASLGARNLKAEGYLLAAILSQSKQLTA